MKLLVGVFKYFLVLPLLGEMIQFYAIFFQMGWNHQLDYMYLHLPWKSSIHVGKYTIHGSCTYLNLPRVWNLDPIKIKLRAEIWPANGGSKWIWITKQEASHQEFVFFWVYFGWIIFFGSKPILLDTPWAHCDPTCSQYWYIASPTRIWRIRGKKSKQVWCSKFLLRKQSFPRSFE